MYDGETPEAGESTVHTPSPTTPLVSTLPPGIRPRTATPSSGWNAEGSPVRPDGWTLYTPDDKVHYSAPMDFADLEQRIAFYRLQDHQVQYLIDRLYERLPEVDEASVPELDVEQRLTEEWEKRHPRVIIMRPKRKELLSQIRDLEMRSRIWMFTTIGLGGLLILTTVSHIIERGGI